MIINHKITNSKTYITMDNAIAAVKRALGGEPHTNDSPYDIIVVPVGERFSPVVRWNSDNQHRVIDSVQAGFYTIV